MAGSNTEQPMNKAEQKKSASVKTDVKATPKTTPVKTEKTSKTTEKKAEVKVQPKVKKDTAKAYGKSITSSTKVAAAICKFLKGKTLTKAIEDLEAVTQLKKAVPMKGEIPHRKGRIMSGRFPERAAKEFIVIVKNLQNNANQNDMEAPVITGAVANKAVRPFAKGGRAKKKKTHVELTATEKKLIKSKKKKE